MELTTRQWNLYNYLKENTDLYHRSVSTDDHGSNIGIYTRVRMYE